jgi:hypothetical protein
LVVAHIALDEFATKADRYAISSSRRGDDWADIIDTLTLDPEARREVVRLLGEIGVEVS